MSNIELQRSISDLKAGKPIVLADDPNRESECDLVMAARYVTPELIRYFTTYTSGLICVTMSHERLEQLEIPSIVEKADVYTTYYGIPVDAAYGVRTGISSFDRAHTIKLLADSSTTSSDLRRPGHINILYANKGGLAVRQGHTEASVRLMELASIYPSVALISEITDRDLNPVSSLRVRDVANSLSLAHTTVADVAAEKLEGEDRIVLESTSLIHTNYGLYRIYVFRNDKNDVEYPVLVYVDEEENDDTYVRERFAKNSINLRIHSGCVTGNIFFSKMCDCYDQLLASMSYIHKAKNGMVIYLPDHEGRGIGLAKKIEAYALQQDLSLDTIEANLALKLPVDARDYSGAIAILKYFDIKNVNLISNNPVKKNALIDNDIAVSKKTVKLDVKENKYNSEYITTKRKRLGHAVN
jgi:3,4-dihydroxy 2-butanone 4-phosphate synthase/GTP cyclohydrolase II